MRVARVAGDAVRSKLANISLTPAEKSAAILSSAQSLKRAYFLNAFSDHFGTDQFSAGHLQTPRPELVQLCGNTPGGLLANYQHDESNRNGVAARNLLNNTWVVYGDGNFFDRRNQDNIRIAQEAVRVSRKEVLDAFLGATTPAFGSAGLLLRIPIPDTGNPSLPCPLFRTRTNGVLEIRNNMLRPENWVADTVPPFDASVATCPVSPGGVTPCSYATMDLSNCPGAIELLFAKQSFLDPSQFGARVLCFDLAQRAYVSSYINVPLSGGQIAAIVICSVVGAALLALLIVFIVFKCYRAALRPNVDIPMEEKK